VLVLLSSTLGPLGVSARASYRVFQANTAPTIAPVSRKAIKVPRGGNPVTFVVATVADAQTPAGDLVVTLVNAPAGLTVTNITNTNGTVRADLALTCNAPGGKKNFTLQVSDGSLTNQANINYVAQANPGPVIGAYGVTTVQATTGTTITPSAPPTDNGSVMNVTVAITSPAGYTGGISIDPVTGIITVTNAGPQNTYTGTVTATDNCGTVSTRTFTLDVTTAPNQPPVANAGSPQTVPCCSIVQLDGSASSDPDNAPGPFTYSWTQVSGNTVVLFGANTATPSFQSLNVSGTGTVTFQLTVNDGQFGDSAFVTITVNEVTMMHVDTEALFVNGGNTYFLHNCNFYGPADNSLSFGSNGEVPVAGDFDGDGIDTIGGYDPATSCFFLRDTNAPGPADQTVCYGPANAIPLIGDWDGDGTDTVGVYRPADGTFLLRNSNTPGNADIVFQFGGGGPGIIPLKGDWNGDGVDTIGLYIQSTGVIFLRNSNSGGAADVTFTFGAGGPDNLPVTGNFDGVGGDSVGLYINSTGVFFLRNVNASGPADIVYQYGVGGFYTPIMGNWDGL
jgi:hypothetical protein